MSYVARRRGPTPEKPREGAVAETELCRGRRFCWAPGEYLGDCHKDSLWSATSGRYCTLFFSGSCVRSEHLLRLFFFEKISENIWHFFKAPYYPAKRGKHHQLSNEKGGENVEPNRREFIKQCAFQKFCNTVLHNEACDAHKELHRHKAREITFSDLTLEEARQLHTFDEYFKGEIAFERAGKKITPKLLLEAIRTLPEEKRKAVLLYYFEGMNDTEIAELFDTSRSTIQYRRTSSFELLKKYLEENADEWDEW